MKASVNNYQVSLDYQALLNGVAEELKLPLMYIARRTELAIMTQDLSVESLRSIQTTATSALELVDSYLLGLQIAENQQVLELEPVSTSSTLYDVAQSLKDIARRYDVSLRLDISGNHMPVMANKPALTSALLSLSTAYIEAQTPIVETGQKRIVTLATHRVREGVVAGIYSDSEVISLKQLRRAFELHSNNARQPFNQLSSSSAAGLFIARKLLQAMSAELKTIRHHRQSGLAAILSPSRQLQFI